MKFIRRIVLCATLVLFAAPVAAQSVAPMFEQVPAVLYETYRGTTSDFVPYFEMLVDKYNAAGEGTPWAIYRENGKVSYRITVLPEGLESLPGIQAARGTSSSEFTDAQWALWNTAWGTRHAAVYTAVPQASVVPEGFSLDDARALTYHRTTIYHIKWDQLGAFREALTRRAELDRAAKIDNFVWTVWNGGVGTETQTIMVRVMAESEAADQGANREARRAARSSYIEEFRAAAGAMNDAAWHIESHDQNRINDLSWSPAGN